MRRAQSGGIGDAPPEPFQCQTSPLRPTLGDAAAQNRSIHGPGRGAGNAIALNPGYLQHSIQDAPGEGTVRATAL